MLRQGVMVPKSRSFTVLSSGAQAGAQCLHLLDVPRELLGFLIWLHFKAMRESTQYVIAEKQGHRMPTILVGGRVWWCGRTGWGSRWCEVSPRDSKGAPGRLSGLRSLKRELPAIQRL